MSLDIEMKAGDSLRIDSTVKNKETGVVENVTGATGTFIVYDAPRGTSKITGTFTLNAPTSGTVIASLDDSQTDIYVGEYHVFYYQVKITLSGGAEYVIESGKLIIS